MFKKRTAKVKTTDDWYPNYPDNEVEVSIMSLVSCKEDIEHPTTYRICVWGADDCGMEFDVETKEPHAMMMLYNNLISGKPLTKNYLSSLGFVSA